MLMLSLHLMLTIKVSFPPEPESALQETHDQRAEALVGVALEACYTGRIDF